MSEQAGDQLPLFPDRPDLLPRPRKPSRPWHMTARHREVLRYIALGPQDDRQIINQFLGEARAGTNQRYIEELAKRGHLSDTGERTDNRLEGRRCILWTITPKGSEARHA